MSEELQCYIDNITEYNSYMADYDKYLKNLNVRNSVRYKLRMEELMLKRHFSKKVVDRYGITYVEKHVELLQPEFMSRVESFGVISPTNNMPIYQQRYLIPIKNEYGMPINVVGYMWDVPERYVYGTAEYYRRSDDLFGLERYNDALDYGIMTWTEGITDTIAVQDTAEELDYKSSSAQFSHANCGTTISEWKLRMMNRPRYGTIIIPDRDEAGDGTVKKLLRGLNKYILLRIPIGFKDIDQYLNKDIPDDLRMARREQFLSYLADCETELRKSVQLGVKCGGREVQMYRLQ